METANTLTEAQTAKLKHRDWHIIPDTRYTNHFSLEETKTGKVLGTLVLPKSSDTALLNLIGCAPELEDIAEMYHDHMLGGPMEKSMVFTTVQEILTRLDTTNLKHSNAIP